MYGIFESLARASNLVAQQSSRFGNDRVHMNLHQWWNDYEKGLRESPFKLKYQADNTISRAVRLWASKQKARNQPFF